MAIIRKILGSIILFFNWLFTPKGITREQVEQQKVDAMTEKLKLYQYNACPFCVKVRRAMKRLSLSIELRDAKTNLEYKKELEQEAGKLKVPCLRIENEDGSYTWMYESADIINYLSEKFKEPLI